MKHPPIAAAALILALAGCGGGDDSVATSTTAEAPTQSTTTAKPADSPEKGVAALKHQFDLISKGQWGRNWDELHPAQQAFIPRERYVECLADESFELTDITVLETFEEPMSIDGTDLRVDSLAITVRITANGRTETDTFHEVFVDGRWAWVSSDAEMFRDGECP